MTDEPIVIEMKRTDQLAVFIATVIGGGAFVAFLPDLAGWLLELPWVPWHDPLRLALTLGQKLSPWALAIIGGLLGVGAGFLIVHGEPTVSASVGELIIQRGDRRHRFARSQVRTAMISNKRLTVRDRDDVELLSIKLHPRREVATALREKGWTVG
ncbi:YqeB family protein [Mesorhizobium retamae]|uniref:YqeB PH domain-containing protein n=1 Tax=Mesorhizobium retamae TaxID=2912854 RepID=A0ABS9QKL7_9HYPH|nr:hypothetical protein [Mesorhizobium sp. IRAMC:0171]MCG7507276.1 hypothetical protein [Mesorhizobium sp. IRAMC:0171]